MELAYELMKEMESKDGEDNHIIEEISLAPDFYYDLATEAETLIHIDHTGKKWFHNVAVELDPRQTEKFIITSRPR